MVLTATATAAERAEHPKSNKPLRYDFGTASVLAAKDYVRVGAGDLYSKKRGYGLVPSSTDKDR